MDEFVRLIRFQPKNFRGFPRVLLPGKGGEGGAKDFGCVTIKFT